MPGTTGIQLHEFVHGRDREKARRFVFMSGDFANEDVYNQIHETGQPLLEKPFTTDELVTVLRRSSRATGTNRIAAASEPGVPPRPDVSRRKGIGDDVRDHADADSALGSILRPD